MPGILGSMELLWIPATLAAAAAQTARNAMQHGLTASLGTVGATQVRFLYGFPFALAFLALVTAASGVAPPPADARFLAWTLAGAAAQIVATALMLAAMRLRNFAVAIAYTKTEPLQVVLFELVVLAAALSPASAAATAVATAGVVLLSWKPGQGGGPWPALMGMASGAFFAVAAIGFRGGILALPEGSFVLRASTTLAWSLGLQTAILLAWLAAFDRKALVGSTRVWRASLGAGFLGALASQFWFIGFALTAAANVRTLGLAEVLFAALISRRLFAQAMARREAVGLALVVMGVGLLLVAA